MVETAADTLIDSLVADFGGNYTFALDLLEQYRADRRSVEASWREYFDRMTGAAPEAAPAPPAAAPPPSSVRPGALVRQEPSAPARTRSQALVVPAILPGDIATPIRGGAVRI
ncbi:MAG: hypothetical protein DMF81_09805, partial [Acidobacteria bacterium]